MLTFAVFFWIESSEGLFIDETGLIVEAFKLATKLALPAIVQDFPLSVVFTAIALLIHCRSHLHAEDEAGATVGST